MKCVKLSTFMNQTCFVEDTTLKQMVELAIKDIPTIKTLSINVKIDDTGIGYHVQVKAQKDKNAPYSDTIYQLQKNIENYSKKLINSKPSNITVILENKLEHNPY